MRHAIILEDFNASRLPDESGPLQQRDLVPQKPVGVAQSLQRSHSRHAFAKDFSVISVDH